MVEFFINFADKIFKFLSVRKIMYWLLISFVLYILTPPQAKMWLDKVSPNFINGNYLTITGCLLVGFLFLDISSLAVKLTNGKFAASKIKKDLSSFSAPEIVLIKKLLPCGTNPLYFGGDNKAAASLMNKGY